MTVRCDFCGDIAPRVPMVATERGMICPECVRVAVERLFASMADARRLQCVRAA